MESTKREFHPFPLLPIELRCEIYLLATPPRIVHLKEGFEFGDDHDSEEYEEFIREPKHDRERWKLTYVYDKWEEALKGGALLQAQLHPDITYFAHNWRIRIGVPARPCSQTLLEHWGFTSPRGGPLQPWPPSAETPEIPMRWLEDHPLIAFELLRKSYLYSEAPIPPLLHTCSESRQVLMDFGYQLAFRTRTFEPRTWFNFGRDRLYMFWLPDRDVTDRDVPLLSGCRWDFGQYRSEDLQRVQYLVLNNYPGRNREGLENMHNLLPLVPNLRELSFEEWDQDLIDEWLSPAEKGLRKSFNRDKNGNVIDLWKCILAEDIDPVGQTLWTRNVDATGFAPPPLYSLGEYNALFNHNRYQPFRAAQMPTETTFDISARLFQESLSSPQAATLHGFSTAHWNVPEIRFVHIGSETKARGFSDGRHRFWQYFVEYQKAFTRDKPFRPLTVDAPRPPPPFRMVWCGDSQTWQRAIEAVQDLDPSGITNHFSYYYGSAYLQAWYLLNVSVPEPGLELI